ncbi:MAG: STAS domain-containing protein [Proteobacteria bacterium]|nr:STAS domain-containing protein [Pseudomonadota bacterium]MBU1449495.1 STAS domain-containing protein [Pseudomonadota bacterium]MBU2467642.1 STAS domain-containing protein [Pseudomonadota bacterium]MBU2517476.1 STAS domain-containing protein [Pseudomonadota bacterium]
MRVEERLVGNVLVVTIQDIRLDAIVAAPLHQRLHQHTQNGCNKLVLDLGSVEFMDSSGLTVIMSTLKSLNEQGGRLVLSGMGANLGSLFQLTRLDKVFQVYPNTGQAVLALSYSK